MDFITRNITGFKASVITSLGPISGIVFSTPSFVHTIWFSVILKIGVVVIGTGISGMVGAGVLDVYEVRYKNRIRTYFKPKKDKDGPDQKAA
jgi:ABC-type Fe3+ transport system permease subunit